MRVTVRYFAAHRDLAGVEAEPLELPEGATVADLVGALLARHEWLGRLLRDTIISVNKGLGKEDTVLQDGDEVAVFPPISGG